MEQGDVLVVRYTTPTYNAVLTMAGALVSAEGGSMSHAAVIARELGLPAVIGAAGAMDQINDGDMITVDPIRGTVSGS
jgi:pyruvate,water dikinase